MAFTNVSGPAFLYFSRTAANSYPANNTTIFFLGTGEQPPQIQLNPRWEPIHNDIGGLVPIDYSYQGEDGLVSVVLNSWNEAIYSAMATHDLAFAVRGKERWDDIGGLAQGDAMTFHLWIDFPYATSKTYGATYGLPACYHFPACRLANHLIGPGTSVNRRHLVIAADRSVRLTTSSSTSGFLLYDHTNTYLPSVPPTAATGVIS